MNKAQELDGKSWEATKDASYLVYNPVTDTYRLPDGSRIKKISVKIEEGKYEIRIQNVDGNARNVMNDRITTNQQLKSRDKHS